MDKIELLKKMYLNQSKHSNYQLLASNFEKIIDNNDLDIKSRYEKERFNYINNKLNLNGFEILDIGGNTGFFSFESINKGAKKVNYVEGNKEHSEFVKLGAEVLGLNDKINVENKYYLFDDISNNKFNCIYLLNVLHHIGDDYGDNEISKNNALNKVIESLKNISFGTEYLVFQLGFNWKGDRNLPLFNNGTKSELINFIKDGISEYYDILNIGIAEDINGEINYNELNEKNIIRNDKLGEFLNRPLFIMKSKGLKIS